MALIKPVASSCVVEEPNQEEDSPRYVDERVYAVDPMHKGRILHEEVLDLEFVEDVETLLEVDELQSMVPRDVHGAFDYGDGRECATKLVDLRRC